MPIYEYRCEECGHEMDALQKLSDAPLTDCPECGKPALKKLISAVGFRLKGSGWYETDFKSGAKKNLHEPASKKADKPAAGGKPAAAGKPVGGDKPTAAAKSAAAGKAGGGKPAAAKGTDKKAS